MCDSSESNCVLECMGCKDTLSLDHSGIKCLQNHNLCSQCSIGFINLIFAEPQIYLPAKCPDCRTEILMNTVEMQLDNSSLRKLQNLYLVYTLNNTIENKDDVIVSCPFCDYSEIRNKDGINFVFCQNEACQKRSCYFCHLECEYEDIEYYQPDEYEEYDEWNETEETPARNHFECALLDPIKKKIHDAIEDGSKVKCPICKTAGRKDDACTHMTCVKCNIRYCYVCGLSEKECNKDADGVQNIHQHNIDWDFLPLRCPMYLNQIFEVDDRWPGEFANENESLDFFHRLRILKNLRQVIEDETVEKIEIIEKKLGLLEKAGFTIADALNEDTTVILRDNDNDDI